MVPWGSHILWSRFGKCTGSLKSPCLCTQATESAQQWEKRAQQLQQKYGKVDLAEHQRVQAELKTAQTELSQIRAEGVAQLAEVREELTKVPHRLKRHADQGHAYTAQIASYKEFRLGTCMQALRMAWMGVSFRHASCVADGTQFHPTFTSV